jgi:hypothetical protein
VESDKLIKATGIIKFHCSSLGPARLAALDGLSSSVGRELLILMNTRDSKQQLLNLSLV